MNVVETISHSLLEPEVRGFLHRPQAASGDALVLTHGAGGNAQSGLLLALADGFAEAGLSVLRCDLPFRHVRRFGPPRPGDAAHDRRGLANAVSLMKGQGAARIFLGDRKSVV